MAYRSLNHLELQTIAEKDELYVNDWIVNEAQQLAQSCIGVRQWIRFRNAITVLSRFVYFSSSTLSGLTTPGEEYCDSESYHSSLFKDLLTICLNNDIRLPPFVQDTHLITFFLFGDHYELSKRITNNSYKTSDRRMYQSKRMTLIYKLMGFLSLVQLALKVSLKHEQELVNDQPELAPGFMKEQDTNRDLREVCVLCSEKRCEPTSTLCGHVFCWYCIHKWLRERSECPICRKSIEPSRLIHLMNFN